MRNYRGHLAAALLLLLLVAALGWWGGPGSEFDVELIRALRDFRQDRPGLTSAMIVLTQLGSIGGTLGGGLAAAGWLWWAGRRRPALLLAVTVVIERLTVDVLKHLVDRPRPGLDLHPVPTWSASFPSGHAANSLTAFVAIALLAAPPRWRSPALAVAIPLALAIGLTRPALGVHWPSDVLAGWAIAGIALVLLSLFVEAQHDVVGRHFPAAGQD